MMQKISYLNILKAFTMAEAILVMTILGIIATIMISTLKPAEFKEQAMRTMAKKVLSEIDVATTQILMNNTADGTFNSVYAPGTNNILDPHNSFSPESEQLAQLYKTYLTAIRKRPEYAGGMDAFLLKDGASVGITFFAGTTDEGWSIFPGETEVVNTTFPYGWIFFDINDNEPPNVRGKDRFRLPIDLNGIKYAE